MRKKEWWWRGGELFEEGDKVIEVLDLGEWKRKWSLFSGKVSNRWELKSYDGYRSLLLLFQLHNKTFRQPEE